jgi:tRNA(Ile)-lysidine synthase
MPGTFEVASVDHGLREGSAGEAAEVARVCAVRGIPHETLNVTVAAAGNLQANARDARYHALASWLRRRGLGVLATGHHADDQAETLLMRLARGAGVRGLAAMRAVSPLPGSPDLALVRPLLGWRRAELAGVVAAAGLAAAQDPSNRAERFERVRMRRALGAADWLDPAALAASAANLADADDALEWAARREWADGVEQAIAMWTYRPSAPRAVRLRVLERIVAEHGGGVPRGSDLVRWLEALEQGGAATLAGVKGDGRRLPWRFTAAPARRG